MYKDLTSCGHTSWQMLSAWLRLLQGRLSSRHLVRRWAAQVAAPSMAGPAGSRLDVAAPELMAGQTPLLQSHLAWHTACQEAAGCSIMQPHQAAIGSRLRAMVSPVPGLAGLPLS